MAFKKFIFSGISFRPKVSIRKSGMCGFNNALIKKYNLKNYKYVVLYFDNEKKIIGFKFTNNDNEEGIYRLSIRDKSASFSGKSFLDYYGINYNNIKRYDAEWDNTNKILIIKLK